MTVPPGSLASGLASIAPGSSATSGAPAFGAEHLPPEIAQALVRARLPERALALRVQPVDGADPVASFQASQAMNPASVFKLVTSAAALDRLGPAYTWQTPVYFTGPVQRGELQGSLVIRGSGDPSLVIERLWLLLRHVRALGVQSISGDIVLDHAAFAPPRRAPADFDGESWEPYNVLPDALLLNYKAVTLSFLPEPGTRVARVVAEPPLEGVATDASVPLVDGPCDDWHARLQMTVSDPARWHAEGRYPSTCGERAWPLAYADPMRYDAKLIAAAWRELGGRLGGTVHDGSTPPGVAPVFAFASPPLANVVRDMNKFSNNVMAEQLALTLGLARRRALPDAAQAAGGATEDDAREALADWLRERLGVVPSNGVVIANGSGLARETRLSAEVLARLVLWAWRSPVMPELLASLPV
ncbi:MAG TPA: D-alanyl-D-alanine carboxypeptidase/D-alanyl-D-alanine-endopeptidase, partial [Burkholderiaceae bacterium]|nr:D-alanyl-D-alanine carboxypeptidase/D-alanyl-D-alanine-endopeptidase [Burkholderiaceae bacterium]